MKKQQRERGAKWDVRQTRLCVQIDEPWMLPFALASAADRICVDAEGFFQEGGWGWERAGELNELCQRAGKDCQAALPELFRKEQRQLYEAHAGQLLGAGFAGFLVRNLEEIPFLREQGYTGEWTPDAGLYTMNKEARRMFLELGASGSVLPRELNARELGERIEDGDELVVYGYAPLMITANCLAKTLRRCQAEPGLLYLEDRYRKRFPVKRYCGSCHNVIYNSAPLYLLDCRKELEQLRPGCVRLHFTVEDKAGLQSVLEEAARVFKRGESAQPFAGDFTRGHLKRGVE